MTSILTAAKFDASKMIAHHARVNILTGVSLKLFTLASLVTLILLISKITGLLAIGWFAVFVPVIASLTIGLLFAILALVLAAIATRSN